MNVGGGASEIIGVVGVKAVKGTYIGPREASLYVELEEGVGLGFRV